VGENPTRQTLQPEATGARNLLRPGLCSILKWDDEVVIIKSQPAAIVLISSVLPDGATEPKYLLQRVPIHRTTCHLGGERPWFNCIVSTGGKPCGTCSRWCSRNTGRSATSIGLSVRRSSRNGS
jgi:hypothetical protein